jgi:hypothetical protein
MGPGDVSLIASAQAPITGAAIRATAGAGIVESALQREPGRRVVDRCERERRQRAEALHAGRRQQIAEHVREQRDWHAGARGGVHHAHDLVELRARHRNDHLVDTIGKHLSIEASGSTRAASTAGPCGGSVASMKPITRRPHSGWLAITFST